MRSRFITSTQRRDSQDIWHRRPSMLMKKGFKHRSRSSNGRLTSQTILKAIVSTSISSSFQNNQSTARCDKRPAANELDNKKQKVARIEGISGVNVSREFVDTEQLRETARTRGQENQDCIRNTKWMERGSAPSRTPNEFYKSDSSDSLWNEGRRIVPDGLKNPAQRSEGDERDGDTCDDRDESDGSSDGEEASGSAYGEEGAEGLEGAIFRPAERDEYEEGQWAMVLADQNGRADDALLKSESEEEHAEGCSDIHDARETEWNENDQVPLRCEITGTDSYDPNAFGTAPSRDRNDYDQGDTTDALFDWTRWTQVPAGLRGAAGSGRDDGDGGENPNDAGDGSGGSGGGGNNGGGQETLEKEDVHNNYDEFDPVNWQLEYPIDFPYSYATFDAEGNALDGLQSTVRHNVPNNQPELGSAQSLEPRNTSTAEERELLANPWS